MSDISLQQEVARLTSVVGQLNLRLKKFEDSAQYTFQKNVALADGRNIILGGTQGTKIGTGTSKIGFYGVTPVVQQAVAAIASGSTASDGVARAGVNAIITALIAVGIIKS